jgi:hypothetical protein
VIYNVLAMTPPPFDVSGFKGVYYNADNGNCGACMGEETEPVDGGDIYLAVEKDEREEMETMMNKDDMWNQMQ